ncbi:hypothetical protein GGI17_004943 [Coemansia sp. S146]|nr:hypothetical protein GGI17_004943 [Coemansia sp. S146]
MSPLHIGLVEGLTEQQTAEMVELLTPFLSPASTPAFNAHMLRRPDESRAFSPLTSPALMPQAMQAAINSGPFSPTSFVGGSAAEQYRAQHMLYQQQQQPTDFVSMPPPSPSITAEHIMRRQQQQMMMQQQQQQHSPSFPSVSAAALSPYLPASMGGAGGGSRIGRRRGSTSTGTASGPAAQASSPHSLGSPQYHPYRGSAQQQQQQRPPNGGSAMRSPLANSHQAGQLVYTPSLLSRGAAAADGDEFFLDSLPTSAASPRIAGGQQQTPRNRTLHQLNASPHFASSIFGNAPPAPQRSVSLNSAALAMLSSNSHGADAMQAGAEPMLTAEQFNSWLEGSSSQPPATAPPAALREQQQQSATPASLMNLPLSAHHLPHSGNGEIVSSEGSSSQSPATAAAIVSAFGRQQIAGPSPAASTMSASLLHFVTQSAPMTEFVHPPLPPPLHIGPSESVLGGRRSASAEDSAAHPAPEDRGRRTRRKSGAGGAKPAAKNPRAKRDTGASSLSSAAGRRRSRTSLLSPRQTPLVPSTLKNVSSPGFSPHSMASPGLAPLTPATLAPRRIASSQATPSMGPMHSGSVTPQMRPRAVIAATSTTNIVGLEADVVTRLATKSNYQNIMEGNSEFLGLKYKTEFKSGLERRRTNHKQAEQKRRDSLKTCFQALKSRLPDLDPKLVSKIYLLNRANAFIDSLTRMNELLVAAASEQGIDVAAIAAQAQAAADPGPCYDEEDMSNDDDDDNDMDFSN